MVGSGKKMGGLRKKVAGGSVKTMFVEGVEGYGGGQK